MLDYIITYFKDLIALTNEMSPYLLLGFLFAGLLHVFVPKDKINRYMGRSNIGSAINAAILGIPLPLCSCGVIPTGISFFKNGASKPATVSFLIATPQTGIDSILATYALMGWPFALIRPIIALFTGVLGGLITKTIEKPDKDWQVKPPQTISTNSLKQHRLKRMLRYAFVDFLNDIAKWLIIGLLLAALISALVPDDFFMTYMDNKLLGMLIILAASMPLYVCATGSIPIAVVLLIKGLSPGAALVFLMAGPATNIATMTVISRSMGNRTLLAYLVSIIGGALAFGLMVDWLLPEQWLLSGLTDGLHEHGQQGWFYWLKWTSSIVLTGLIIHGYILKWKNKHKSKQQTDNQNTKEENNMKHLIVKIGGMTCNHCRMTAEKNLGQLEGIEQVLVNLEKEEASIQGDKIDIEQISQTINDLGYDFKGTVEEQ